MKIFEIIAQKVCYAICHMNYDIVKHQAEMLKYDDSSFTVETTDDKIYTICFFSENIWISRHRTRILDIDWFTTDTIDDIADKIVTEILKTCA